MILHEFLPLFIGEALVNEILADGRKFYRPAEAVMPVEFQGAVFRFGHSMVAPLVPGERPVGWLPHAAPLCQLANIFRFRGW